MAGFEFRYTKGGDGAPTIQSVVVGTTALKVGDLVKLDGSQQAVVATTGDPKIAGVVLGPDHPNTNLAAMTSGTTKVKIISDQEAIFGVVDANARKKGARLDITGGTGAMGVTSVTNGDFIVEADSTAAEETLVRLAMLAHIDHQAQT